MNLDFDIRWLLADSREELDKRLLELLTKISVNGSLQSAAKQVGIFYRTAWQIIHHWNTAFETPLCIMERGRGAKLTPLGKKLIDTKIDIESNFTDALRGTASELNKNLDELTGKTNKQKKLVAYASHDLAINFLQQLCEQSSKLEIDFNSRGSLDALKQLQASQYNIAGFHFPEGELAKLLAPEYKQLLDDETHLFIHLTTRQQGLIFKPSLADHIKDINGITRRSIKFINRQKGSGTRAIFDQLIKLNNISKKEVNDYNKEEFTHTAVAAMISSGQADIGFGLKAAASQFKLSFLPLVTEHYVIGMNKSLAENTKSIIRKLLKDDSLKKRIQKLPGYNASITGRVIHANKLLYPVIEK